MDITQNDPNRLVIGSLALMHIQKNSFQSEHTKYGYYIYSDMMNKIQSGPFLVQTGTIITNNYIYPARLINLQSNKNIGVGDVLKRTNHRVYYVVLLAFLILASSMVLYPQPENTKNDKLEEDEIFPEPDSRLGRSSRAGVSWPMYLNNPQHSNFISSVGPTTANISWNSQTGNPTYSSPAVADGMVFIGSDEHMSAYYENNGTLAWRTNTIEPVTGTFGVACSPAYENGYVFFGGDRFYCLYANNGTIKWRRDEPGNIKHGDGSPTLANGKVFIGGSDRKLYCIDQETGNIDWTFQTLSAGDDNWGLYAAPAVANGYVYLSACDGYLYQLNETQPTSVGTPYHIFDMAYASYFSPLVVNDRVYVGCGYNWASPDNRLYCLYASNLTKIWEFYPGTPVSFFCSAGYYNDRIYVGSIGPSNDGNLYCLDAQGGGGTTSVIWQYDIHSTWSSPALTNDRLYIGSKDNYVYCFNLTQALGFEEYLWRYNTQGDVDSSPAVSSGRIFIGSHGNSGRIYCIGDFIPPPTNYLTLKEGWNFISLPFIQQEQDLIDVLAPIDTSYDAVQWYDPTDTSDHWKNNKIGKSIGNDLLQLNEKMGFWIHITKSGDTIFEYNGTEPSVDQSISLLPGWNMVGYPSNTSHNRTVGLNNLIFDNQIDAIWSYDSVNQRWDEMGESDNFELGKGYCIHSKVSATWIVPL
jgi:outer membrane protein assembly factor BamB